MKRFEHMLTMGRESGDRRGLGYELENPNSKSNASTFVKGKGKVASQSTPNPRTQPRVFPKVKATYAQKVKDVQIASTSKQASYLNAHSSTTKRKWRKSCPKNSTFSYSLKNSTSHASLLAGYMDTWNLNVERWQGMRRFLRFQEKKKECTWKKDEKKELFPALEENANLESKKEMERLSRPKTKQIWVKKTWVHKEDLKCLVIHMTLRVESTSKWYLDSGCSRHMISERFTLHQFEEKDEGSVTSGDGNATKIAGRGTIEVSLVYLNWIDVLWCARLET